MFWNILPFEQFENKNSLVYVNYKFEKGSLTLKETSVFLHPLFHEVQASFYQL